MPLEEALRKIFSMLLQIEDKSSHLPEGISNEINVLHPSGLFQKDIKGREMEYVCCVLK